MDIPRCRCPLPPPSWHPESGPHAGTLDPDATGVLIVGVGRGTRLLRFATALPKTYVGEIALGVTTSTLDASGEVTGHFDMGGVTLTEVQRQRVR